MALVLLQCGGSGHVDKAAVAAWQSCPLPPPISSKQHTTQATALLSPSTYVPAETVELLQQAFLDIADESDASKEQHGRQVLLSLLSNVGVLALDPARAGYGLAQAFTAARSELGEPQAALMDARVSRMRTILLDVFWLVVSAAESITDEKPAEAGSQEGGVPTAPPSSNLSVDAPKRLAELLRSLVGREVIPAKLAIERLDLDVLASAHLISERDKDGIATTLKRLSTRMFYTQSKFNLLAEESEGYAKLVTESFASLPDPLKDPQGTLARHHMSTLVQKIQSLIGFFSLDPNRVFDILVDAAELHQGNPHFLTLFADDKGGLYSKEKLSQLVGFKFSRFCETEAPKPVAVENPPAESPTPFLSNMTPQSLYRVAAALMLQGSVCLRTLWLHLGPSAGIAKERAAQLADAYKAAADKFVPPTATTTLALTSLDRPGAPSASADSMFMLGGSASGVSGTASPVSHPAAALAAQIEVESQKLGLMRALYQAGSWSYGCQALSLLMNEIETGGAPNLAYPTPVEQMLSASSSTSMDQASDELQSAVAFVQRPARGDGAAVWPSHLSSADLPRSPPFSAPCTASFDVAACPGVSSALGLLLQQLLRQVSRHLSPLWSRLQGKGALPSDTADHSPLYSCRVIAAPFERLTDVTVEQLAPLLELLGPHLSNDPVALTQLTRIIAAQLKEKSPEVSRDLPIQLLRETVLPSLALSGSNPQLAADVWAALKCLTWPERYSLYTWMKDSGYETHPALLHARSRSNYFARASMKRLAKDTIRQAGRALAKVSVSNPILVCDAIVSTLESMDNLIVMAQDALKFSSPIALDVLTFTIVDRLAMPRSRLQDDGMTPMSWLSGLTQFIGHFYKKFQSQELGGLIQHVIRILVAVSAREASKDTEGATSNASFGYMSEAAKAASRVAVAAETAVEELAILRELLTIMCSHDIHTVALNREQLAACGGSDALRQQYILTEFATHPLPNTSVAGLGGGATAAELTSKVRDTMFENDTLHRAVVKLRDCLLQGVGGGHVGFPLAVMLAQLRQVALFGGGALPPDSAASSENTAAGEVHDPSTGQAPALHPAAEDLDEEMAALEAGTGSSGSTYAAYGLSSASAAFHDGQPPTSLASYAYDFAAPAPLIPLRVVCHRVDAVTASFMQFSDFLRTTSPAFYVEWLNGNLATVPPPPSLRTLVQTHGLPLPVAWHLLRPLMRVATYGGDSTTTTNFLFPGGAPPAAVPTDGDEAMVPVGSPAAAHSQPFSIKNPSLIREATQSLPPATWDSISPRIYVLFWAHSLGDVFVPVKQYEAAVTPLREAAAAFDRLPPPRDRRETEARATARQRLLDALKRLKSDRATQQTHADGIKAILVAERTELLSNCKEKKTTAAVFVQQCLLPRMLLSSEDALYAAKFLLLCLEIDVPYLATLFILSTLFKEMLPVLNSVTEAEAACVGIFLSEVLQVVNGWLEDPVAYKAHIEPKDCMSQKASDTSAKVTHDRLSKAMTLWYGKMASALLASLKSSEYMEIKCAMVLLKMLLQPAHNQKVVDGPQKPVWPTTKDDVEKLLVAVNPLKSDTEERVDIRVLATGVWGQLDTALRAITGEKVQVRSKAMDDIAAELGVSRPPAGGQYPPPSSRPFSSLASDRMASDRIPMDRMASDRMASDRMASDRMYNGPREQLKPLMPRGPPLPSPPLRTTQPPPPPVSTNNRAPLLRRDEPEEGAVDTPSAPSARATPRHEERREERRGEGRGEARKDDRRDAPAPTPAPAPAPHPQAAASGEKRKRSDFDREGGGNAGGAVNRRPLPPPPAQARRDRTGSTASVHDEGSKPPILPTPTPTASSGEPREEGREGKRRRPEEPSQPHPGDNRHGPRHGDRPGDRLGDGRAGDRPGDRPVAHLEPRRHDGPPHTQSQFAPPRGADRPPEHGRPAPFQPQHHPQPAGPPAPPAEGAPSIRGRGAAQGGGGRGRHAPPGGSRFDRDRR